MLDGKEERKKERRRKKEEERKKDKIEIFTSGFSTVMREVMGLWGYILHKNS